MGSLREPRTRPSANQRRAGSAANGRSSPRSCPRNHPEAVGINCPGSATSARPPTPAPEGRPGTRRFCYWQGRDLGSRSNTEAERSSPPLGRWDRPSGGRTAPFFSFLPRVVTGWGHISSGPRPARCRRQESQEDAARLAGGRGTHLRCGTSLLRLHGLVLG